MSDLHIGVAYDGPLAGRTISSVEPFIMYDPKTMTEPVFYSWSTCPDLGVVEPQWLCMQEECDQYCMGLDALEEADPGLERALGFVERVTPAVMRRIFAALVATGRAAAKLPVGN